MHHRILRGGLAAVLGGLVLVWPLATGAAVDSNTIDLNTVLARVLARNPGLDEYPYRFRAADAAVMQADILPSPELSLDVENVAGTGRWAGTDGAEVTLALSQVVELGGQRDARVDSAQRASELSRLDYDLARLDLLGEANRRYLTLAAVERRVTLAQRTLDLAAEAEEAARQRSAAGAAPRSEQRRLVLARQAAERDLQRARTQRRAASQRLAALWGETGEQGLRAAGDLLPLPELPALAQWRERLNEAPRLREFASRARLAQSQARLAEANGSRDVRFSIGARHDEASGDQAAVLGFSMPLNLSNPNRGNQARRLAEVDALQARRNAARIELLALVEGLYLTLRQRRDEIIAIQDQSLPEARRLYDEIQAGYRRGRYSVLDLIDAAGSRLALERRITDLAEEFHQQRNELERLTGASMAADVSARGDSQ
ncbi:MAG: TolC family protein [Alcanivorax sp.]|uniref:TolC family protein n=1 Tax=Alloalcanivorax marinus TaxID=1177169 RepID=A0A9Q3UM24_9GAMM|nr:TolC family protein [Alloalcanivorax marinus]MBM7333071.1 TolC family protein [Alloalcanivorax marinus]MCC4309726.1 TolC family protein [Alloalcanivorax marinus]MCU5787131.1 cobalt/zinc/cadmium efflux RND transporter outermembrane protein [Alloalcanivorax marinus]